jgi:hypothetical protein
MANVTTNEFGLVFEIEHSEVDAVIAAAGSGGAGLGTLLGSILAAAGVGGPITAMIVGAVAAHIAAEAWLIKRCDQGNGVYLTVPWVAVFTGQPHLIIPTTRPPVTPLPPPRWSDQDSGTFGTNDRADAIDYLIERGAVGADIVAFRLVVDPASSGWKKAIDMPDGEGNSWRIEAEGHGGWGENSLWAHQPQNGQALIFLKAKFLGQLTAVLELGDLGGLRGGDRVTFTWKQD